MNEVEIIIREKGGPTKGVKMAISFIREETLCDQAAMEKVIWDMAGWYREIE